jgi:hypothetical protein
MVEQLYMLYFLAFLFINLGFGVQFKTLGYALRVEFNLFF